MGIRRRHVRPRIRVHLFIVAAVVARRRPCRPPPPRPRCSARITAALTAHGFGGLATGVRVFDLSTATALYDRHTATQCWPASNEKLVTSSTALAKWGATFRFKTELLTTGTLDSAAAPTPARSTSRASATRALDGSYQSTSCTSRPRGSGTSSPP